MGRRGPKHPQFDASDDLLDGRVEDSLDLHGYSASASRWAVRAFLRRWRRKPGAIVHIITGKGNGSPNGPVLRGLVKSLLQGQLRSIVAEWDLDDGQGGYKVQVR